MQGAPTPPAYQELECQFCRSARVRHARRTRSASCGSTRARRRPTPLLPTPTPLLPTPGITGGRGGRPEKHPHRRDRRDLLPGSWRDRLGRPTRRIPTGVGVRGAGPGRIGRRRRGAAWRGESPWRRSRHPARLRPDAGRGPRVVRCSAGRAAPGWARSRSLVVMSWGRRGALDSDAAGVVGGEECPRPPSPRCRWLRRRRGRRSARWGTAPCCCRARPGSRSGAGRWAPPLADLPIVGHPWGAGAVDRSNGLAPRRRGLRVFGPIASVPSMTCRERITAPCRWVCEPDPAGHFLAGFLAGYFLAGYRLGGAGVGGAAARTGRRT